VTFANREPITSLTISLTTTLLLAGTSNGNIYLYDIPSYQRMRTISTHNGLVITHLATMLKPPDLIGHVSLSLSASASASDLRDVIPIKPVLPFQKIRDAKNRETHQVSILLPAQDSVRDSQGI
jgi:pre-rRNA-processing protein IPI3